MDITLDFIDRNDVERVADCLVAAADAFDKSLIGVVTSDPDHYMRVSGTVRSHANRLLAQLPSLAIDEPKLLGSLVRAKIHPDFDLDDFAGYEVFVRVDVSAVPWRGAESGTWACWDNIKDTAKLVTR